MNPKLWGDSEKAVVISARRHCESILKALADSGTECQSHKLSEAEDAKIFVYAIFFECFMIRNELFRFGQDTEKVDRVIASLLVRTLNRAVGGDVTKLALDGLQFIDHLAEAKDMVDPSASTMFSDCVARRFLTPIDEILGVDKYSLTNVMLYVATSIHLLAGSEEVYPEIAKLLAA